MPIYAILFFLLIVFWLANKTNNGKNIKIAATAVVFLVIGLRGVTVGADTQVYKSLYESNYDWGATEFGYTWLTSFCNNHDIPFQFFMFMVAAFCAICFFTFVHEYSDDYVFSLILFVGLGNFSMFMTGMRQTIAISIITLAIISMMKNKWYLFFPLVLLASTFHYSSIVFLPIYLVKLLKITRQRVLLSAMLVWGILLLFGNSIFELTAQYYPEQYVDDIIDSAGKYAINLLVIAIELSIFCFCLFSMPRHADAGQMATWSTFMLFQMFVVALQIFATTSMQTVRITYYFDIVKLVLITKALSRYVPKDKSILQLLILALSIAKFFISIPGGYSKIDEYVFFFMT